MFAITVRGMLTHRLRLVLTTASIALGIAFLAGTLILTDTMKHAFDQLFGSVSAGTDAVVRAHSADGATGSAPVPASTVDLVRRVDGIRAAEGRLSGYALLTDTGGRAVESSGGAPTLGLSLPADEQLRGDVRILTGRAPSGPTEVAIDATSATDHAIPVGSRIDILLAGPTQTFTVVGTVGFGPETDLGGSTSAYFDVDTAQQVLQMPGMFEAIDVSAEPGVSQAELAHRIEQVLPDGVEVVTGAVAAQEASDAVKEDMGFFSTMLLTFAGIALFVGSFIIWNTFSMIVTQRTREIALTRAIGATRRQVMASLVLEAALVGLAASAIGLGLGIGVAHGLTALLDAVGFSLPSASTQLLPRTVWLSLVVGTVVTVLSAVVPARRATRVRPVQALHQGVPGARPLSRRRGVAAATITVGGLGALGAGLYGDGGMSLVGLGVLGLVLGVTTTAPLIARPLAGIVGRPLALRGTAGDLARQNAMRNPRRTASTASALMIGLTMVATMGVFATSLKASFADLLGASTKANLYLATSSLTAPGFSPATTAVVEQVPGVATVSPTGWGNASFGGQEATYSAVDPATVEQVLTLDVSSGSVAALGDVPDDDGLVVSRSLADTQHWSVGDVVPADFGGVGPQALTVVGVFDRKGYIDSDYLVDLGLHRSLGAAHALDSSALILVDDGVDVDVVKDRIDAAIAPHPDARVLNEREYQEVAGGFVDQLLTFVTVMLLLAVLIALLGIVNTLALSVFERTRELGLLRAVGMTRAQVRAMVRWEAAVISFIGATTGAGLGIGLGVALVRALKDSGISTVSVSVPQIAIYVVLATMAGVVAAIGPARRAAGVDVLTAVVSD